jgi:hypothetical protein
MDFLTPEVISAAMFVGSVALGYGKLEKRLTALEVTQDHILRTLEEIKEQNKCR